MNLKKHLKEVFGKEVKNQDFGDFVLVESLYSPTATMPRHTHETAHFSIALQGNFTEVSGSKTRSSEASTLIIHPPDEDHAVMFHNSGARVFSFHIKPQMHERIRDYTNILDVSALSAVTRRMNTGLID
jgi:quercetin dioxygenase-like cupin family protein